MSYKNILFGNDNLKGRDFENEIFENCRFVGNIKFVNFLNCKFKSCDLSQGLYNITSFIKCSFPDSKLSNIDFADIRIESCNFETAVMENCLFQKKKKFLLKSNKFINTDLQKSVFVYCDLEDLDFMNSNLISVIFERCNLKNTSFNGAKIEGVGFENCNIEKTVLDMQGFISYGSSKGFILDN